MDAAKLLTNFSKGILSPKVEARPDLAAYFEGLRVGTNWNLMRQGGLDRRVGTKFINEVKNSADDTVIIPFVASVTAAFALEFGNNYIRFYKDKARIVISGSTPYEIASPYTAAQVRELHFSQSVDVLFIWHKDVAQRKLSRISDTNWVLSQVAWDPPATTMDDFDISEGTVTLTPGATTGNNVTFTASAAKFFDGDVGRLIIFGASRAVITQLGPSAGSPSPNAVVKADIIDAFPDTNPIPAGSWFLRLAPQSTLDPNIKEPKGAICKLVAAKNSFRSYDLGKFIVIYGGLIKITKVTDAKNIEAEILQVMDGTDVANPPAAQAGAWTLEIPSWSAAKGFPRTGGFYQGRLGQASTATEPVSYWLSMSDNFESYAPGINQNNAISYTLSGEELNRIEWMLDNVDLFLGTSGSEHRAKGDKNGDPIGGDQVPLVTALTNHGSAPIKPVRAGNHIIFVGRSQLQIFVFMFDIQEDRFDTIELTDASDEICGRPEDDISLRTGHTGYMRRTDPRLFYVRTDGKLVTLTYFPRQKVVGFTLYETEGSFESVCVIPQGAGRPDQLWAIVKRTVQGAVKKYVEVFDERNSNLLTRAWRSLQTDCAITYAVGAPQTVFSVPHLKEKTVDVIANGGYRGTFVVDLSGNVTLPEAAQIGHVEIGLHYNSDGETLRPAIEGQMLEGIPRQWQKVFLRLLRSYGGKINGEDILYPALALDSSAALFTGDVSINDNREVNTNGSITFQQNLPYPMTILGIFGKVDFGTDV